MTWSPNRDFLFDVVQDLEPEFEEELKFGRNFNMASGAREEIWDGNSAYTFPSTADITHIKSDDAADTENIEIKGLTLAGALVEQSKAVSGTSLIALDTPLWRIFRMRVDDTTDPAGNIEAYDSTGTTLYAKITNPYNQTLMAVYTVPAGYTGYLFGYYFSMNKKVNASCPIELWFRPQGKVFNLKHVLTTADAGTTMAEKAFRIPYKIPAMTDVVLRGVASAAGVDVSAGFDLVLKEN